MNGIKLTENDSIGLSHTSPTNIVLTLRNVTSSDAGNYMCIATLAGHSVSATIVVDVLSESQYNWSVYNHIVSLCWNGYILYNISIICSYACALLCQQMFGYVTSQKSLVLYWF